MTTARNEGTNSFYKASAIFLLMCMSRFRSTKFPDNLRLVAESVDIFRHRLETGLDETFCASPDELRSHGLLKNKHYYYGGYLSVLTSLPILTKSATYSQILSSMVAKTSAITSIKVLDNIHDKLSSKQRAVYSQFKHLGAFTEEIFDFELADDFLKSAENSCMRMARWTHDLVSGGLNRTSDTIEIYRSDFVNYIDGQIRSMDEKAVGSSQHMTIRDYLQRVNEKSVGKIWVDIDFCFLEKALGRLDENELKSTLCARKAADYFFKGCNLYDDIADLKEDLKLGIFNSVPLLALDRGKIDESDFSRDRSELLKILKRRNAIDDTLQLADLIFLKGIKPLLEARELGGTIDVDALIFGAKILRAFAIRKWLFHERTFNSLFRTAVSFGNTKMYKISDHIAAFSRYI
jgi:hypothetical protein